MKKAPKVRANVYLSEDVVGWYDEQAKRAGVSRSAYMAMALQTFMEQRRSLDMLRGLPELIERVERLKE